MRTAICSMILAVASVGLSISSFSQDSAAAASTAARCSDSSLRGSYGLHATGTTPGGPFAAVGVFSFDGAGHLTGNLFTRLPGINRVTTLTGIYNVNPDCTVSDTWNFPDGTSSQHESVIVDGGRGYFILNITAGENSVISGEAREQFRGRGN